MAIQFAQIAYKEVLFNFDNNTFKTGASVSVKMTPLMKGADFDDDAIVLQLTVEYHIEERPILKYAGVTLFLANEWRNITPESEEFKDFKLQIWTQALGFFRGIVCEKVKGTEIERFFLPQMPASAIDGIPFK